MRKVSIKIYQNNNFNAYFELNSNKDKDIQTDTDIIKSLIVLSKSSVWTKQRNLNKLTYIKPGDIIVINKINYELQTYDTFKTIEIDYSERLSDLMLNIFSSYNQFDIVKGINIAHIVLKSDRKLNPIFIELKNNKLRVYQSDNCKRWRATVKNYIKNPEKAVHLIEKYYAGFIRRKYGK